ncbi:carbohydrate porin [Vibrio tubiashii]|nr:carbohydrate porin [Vibrio tubiashii]
MTVPKYSLPLLISLAVNNAYAQDILERDRLLGDMGGLKKETESLGVYFDVEYTSVFQADNTDDSTNTLLGRLDLKTTLNLSQMGLWNDGSLHFQVQAHHGENGQRGFVSSPYIHSNTAGFMGDDLFLSSFYYLHHFESASLLVGKIDAFELLKDGTFYGGAGRYGFMNLAFSAPPSGIIPPAFLGAMVNWKTDKLDWSAMVFDPKNRYSEDSFSNPFSDGVAASITVSHTRELFGRTSNFSVSGSYSNSEGKDLDRLFDRTAKVDGKYNFRVQASHNLFESESNPAHSWGVYARAATADGNPNALESTFTAGIGGKSFIADRHQDQWGIGYFKNNVSDELQSSLQIEQLPSSLEDENGVEIYYSYALTPAVNITADVQYIESMDDTSNLLFGLRTNIRL